jgi:hypothetical protein
MNERPSARAIRAKIYVDKEKKKIIEDFNYT